MEKVKVLVAFYSRTGNAMKVAQAIAKSLDCEVEEIIDAKSRSGFFGLLSAGWSAVFKRLTVIEEIRKDPGGYDIVIVGAPIWASRVASGARTYLSRYRDRFKRVAFFCTCGSLDQKNAFTDMAELCGKEPVALLEVTAKEVERDEHISKMEEFTRELTTHEQTE